MSEPVRDLPEILDLDDVAQALRCSRDAVRNLVHQEQVAPTEERVEAAIREARR